MIVEFPGQMTFKKKEILQAQFRNLLQAASCKDLACLRSLDDASLANASRQAYIIGIQEGNYAYGDFYYSPTLDGRIVQDLPSVAFDRRRFKQIPLLTDRDVYEGMCSLFIETNLFACCPLIRYRPTLYQCKHKAISKGRS